MSRRARQRGFTLTELLVAVAIIAMVVALVIPAVQWTRTSAQRVREVSALRQVLTGWTSYAVDNSGQLLPGFKSGLPVSQANGEPIPANVAGSVSELKSRFPWRLMRYLDYDFRALYVNESESWLQQLQSTDPQQFYYLVSLYPSFGLNSAWVGGDQQRYGFLPRTLPSGSANPLSGFYATRLSSFRHPERVTVFASSRTSATMDSTIREGFFRIESPWFVAGQPSAWAAEYKPDAPQSWGNLSARVSGDVAVGTPDGAATWVPAIELKDMRRWADQATSAQWGISAQ